MKLLISHRGNINGRDLKWENHPDYLLNAFNNGYEVEADIWYDSGWWSGHDNPKYKIKFDILKYFWCHAKNADALSKMVDSGNIHCFWHQEDDYTLTSKGYIWIYSGKSLILNCIAVLPENGINGNINECIGICSDKISDYK